MTNTNANTPSSTSGTNAAATSSTLLAGKDVKDFKLVPPMIDVRGWDVVIGEGSKVGVVDRFMLDRIKTLPLLTSDVVTRDFERQLIGTIKGKPANPTPEAQWYADPMFDAAKLFGSKPASHVS